MTFLLRGNYWRVHEEDQQHSFKYSAASDIRGIPYNLIIRKHVEITKFRTSLSLSLSLSHVSETVKLFL